MEECNIHSLICDVAVLADGSVLLVRYSDLAKYENEAGGSYRTMSFVTSSTPPEPRGGSSRSSSG